MGRECLLYLIAVLCENYGKNKFITHMVDKTRIHIMPSMNPDGYEYAVRFQQKFPSIKVKKLCYLK